MTLSFRRLRFLILRGIILSMLIWLGMAAAAQAHASLHMAEPRDGSVVAVAPASIKLFFSEPVSPTRLTITKPDGSSSPLQHFTTNGHVVEIEPPADLAEGTCLVSWRVVSEDGHPVGGTIVYSVGTAQAVQTGIRDVTDWGVRLGLWVGRTGMYAGLLLGVGGVFAVFIFCRGSMAAARSLRIILSFGVLGILVSVGFQGLDTVGRPMQAFFHPDIWWAGLTTSFGRSAAIAIVALALASMALIGKRPSAPWMAGFALAAASLGPSLSGHASTAEPQWLMPVVIFIHISAAAVWAGALVPLALDLRSGSGNAAGSLRRFSFFIPLAVLALVISGAALAIVQVRSINGLSTPYGTILMVKLALLVPLFALAAFNRWRLTANALRGIRTETAILGRVIVIETVFVLAVLGVVAAWRFTPPPRSVIAEMVEPETLHLHSDRAMAVLTVTRDSEGRSRMSVSIMSSDFSPLVAQEVKFVLSNPAAGIEPITRQAAKDGEAEWTMGGLTLPGTGPWTIRIDILVDDFTLYTLKGKIRGAP